MSDEGVNVLDEVDIISPEAVEEQTKAEAEEKLIPAGKYDATCLSYNKVEESEKGDNNQFKGVPLYSVGIVFYDCPEIGKRKSGWFKMTTAKVLNENGRPRTAYTTAVGLTKAMDKVGAPFTDSLEQWKAQRCKVRVGVFDTPEGKKVNFLRGVTAI